MSRRRAGTTAVNSPIAFVDSVTPGPPLSSRHNTLAKGALTTTEVLGEPTGVCQEPSSTRATGCNLDRFVAGLLRGLWRGLRSRAKVGAGANGDKPTRP